MTRILTLLEMDESAIILNGQLIDGDRPVLSHPLVPEFTGPANDESRAEWLKVVRWFTRLRSATEVRAALDDLGADEEDIEALVDDGLLIVFPPTRWLDWPDSEWEQHAWLLGSLVVMHLAPPAPLQSYGPDGVALALPDRDERVAVIDRFSVEVIRDAMREPRTRLGLALERTAALQGREREKAWRRLGADLATLLGTGTAAVAAQPWITPCRRAREALIDAHPALNRPKPAFETVWTIR